MGPVLRTAEGEPVECRVCGNEVSIEPSRPYGDATCPKCGSLLWLNELKPETTKRLAMRGVAVETDGNGVVVHIRLRGPIYDDSVINTIAAGFVEVPELDIRATAITASGAARLRELMPDTVVIGHDEVET